MIMTDKGHRTVIALIGASMAIVLGVLTQPKAIAAVDFNTMGLLIGMMIIVAITRQSGLFEYVAIKAAKISGGKPIAIMIDWYFMKRYFRT
jgi:Na+/H+ antiporter NhaD/arsenite permease-like protein